MKNKIRTVVLIGLITMIGFCLAGCANKTTKNNTQVPTVKNNVSIKESMQRKSEMLNRRIQQNPNDYRAYTQRAMNKMQIHDYKGANDDLNKALEIKSDYNVAINIKRRIEKRH